MSRKQFSPDILSFRPGNSQSSHVCTRPSCFKKLYNSCGFAVITLQDSTEFGLATNTALRIRNKRFVQNSVVSSYTSMRPLLVIIFQPHAKDVIELSSTEADEMVQQFSLRSTDIAFTESVRHRGAWWNFDWSHFGLFPKFVEFVRVLSITIPNEEFGVDAFVFHPHRGVPRLLHYPLRIRMIGARTTVDCSTAQMDKHEDIGIAHPTEGEDRLRKKVARDNAVEVGMNKGRPGNRRILNSFVRLGEVPFLPENVSDSGRSYSNAQLFEFSDNPAATPPKVLSGESAHQVTNRSGGSWPSELLKDVATRPASQPGFVGFGPDNLDDIEHVMVQEGAQANQLRLFHWSRDDAARVDARTQHADLKFKHPNSCVVPWHEPLAHHRNKCTEPRQIPDVIDTQDPFWRAAKSLHIGCMEIPWLRDRRLRSLR